MVSRVSCCVPGLSCGCWLVFRRALGGKLGRMTDPALIKSTVKLCMFDQYGTVVDMQGGLIAVATPYLKAKGWTGRPDAFVTWWRRMHYENSMIDALLLGEHTPYREIGHRSVDQ